MKRVLITAGQVYGRLDDNKLVGNRSRGIWALKFASFLSGKRKGEMYQVTLLVPDTMQNVFIDAHIKNMKKVHVVRHDGFGDYKSKCEEMALTHDAAVMASAVVNWIPAEPVSGKMKTKGYKVGDRIDIPFYLAPRVIESMRRINPHLTLIGCKMLAGSVEEELIAAAYTVVRNAKCNVVLANDMVHGLRRKYLVYPDRTVFKYRNDWKNLYGDLRAVIDDTHWHTEGGANFVRSNYPEALALFDRIADKYRGLFCQSQVGDDHVFGSILVPLGEGRGYLVSPRKKDRMFTSRDAVFVAPRPDFSTRTIVTGDGAKATLNAPLLVRMAETYIEGGERFPKRPVAVLHLHEQLPGVPTEPYAPPGTGRDNARVIHQSFNIKGHGFVALMDSDMEALTG